MPQHNREKNPWAVLSGYCQLPYHSTPNAPL